MGHEHESTDLGREVDASMRLFERSQVGPAMPITPIKPSRVLLVLDGSSQDDAGIDAASYLRERFDVETWILDARDTPRDDTDDLAAGRVAEVSGSRPIKRKAPIKGKAMEAYDAILAAANEQAVDIVIVPCPFGRSFEHVRRR